MSRLGAGRLERRRNRQRMIESSESCFRQDNRRHDDPHLHHQLNEESEEEMMGWHAQGMSISRG